MDINNTSHYRLRRTLSLLSKARGAGTSMISLILPPRDQITRAIKMLTNEYGTASNIKSRVNRASVQNAITSALNRLKSYSKVYAPENGLAIFSGTVLLNSIDSSAPKMKEKKINLLIEPVQPIKTSLYLCDNKFHVDSLLGQFTDNETYGIITVDGEEAVFATLNGEHTQILKKITVDLPKKHGRGGQSSVRFARLRVEKRNAYVKRCAEICTHLYDKNLSYIFAGPADFKNEIRDSQFLRVDIQKGVLCTIDTNYGGEMGMKQAIYKSSNVLKENKYAKEVAAINLLFKEINENGNFAIGDKEVLQAIESNAVDTIICYEDLAIKGTYDIEMEEDDNLLNIFGSEILLIDYLMRLSEQGADFNLMFVSDKTAQGLQLKEGLGGIGATMKFRVDFEENEEEESLSSFDEDNIF